MKINDLISRSYQTTSVLEDTRDVLQFLQECEYLAVIDEESQILGIVTLKDLNAQPESRNLIDCDINKPIVTYEHTIKEVFHLMRESGSDYLPVYDQQNFVGVIDIITITSCFATVLEESKREYQKVIHDLRNPISNIYGLIGLFNNAENNNENIDVLKLCDISCKHALNILDDLLYVEIEESKPLSKVITELNGFYKQCLDEQTGLCVQKNIKIIVDFCGTKYHKEIDPVTVKRAVQNVIANAIKFSYPDSSIKIKTKMEGGKMILKIVDAGIGIPDHYHDQIFEKFTVAGRSGTKGEPSTGLGLCFTKQCLEQHGGEIYFKSTEGKGSKFYIRL